MFKKYLKPVWRGLTRHPKVFLINVTGLSVGMTAALFIFLWVNNERTFDDYNKDVADIYQLTTNLSAQGWHWETTPLLLADAIHEEVPEISKTARLFPNAMPVFRMNGSLSYEKNCAFVDSGWFRIFHYDLVEGNAGNFGEDPNGIILTVSAAKKYFGTEDALGKNIRVDSLNFIVTAVIKDATPNSSFRYDAYLPLQNLLRNADRKANDENWDNANYITFIKARRGTNMDMLARKITTVLQQRSGDIEKESSISLVNLGDLHFSAFGDGSRTTVEVFTVLGILLLLIACINYVNLTTARAGARAREVSVRKIIGAGKRQLFYQFVFEAVLVSLIALLSTLFLAHLCLPVFNAIAGNTFTLSLESPDLWKITGLTLLAAFILNSIYPAIVLSSFEPLVVLRGFTLLRLKDSVLRKVLVTLQFTISVALIAATIVIYKQMQFVQHSNPGYNRSRVFMAAVPPEAGNNPKGQQLLQLMKQQLKAHSSVENVTLASHPIINIGSFSTGSADWPGRDTGFNPKIAQLSADADYAATMKLHLLQGRWFEKGSVADNNNVILNETAIRDLHLLRPLYGQRFTWKGRAGTVIGIVKDFKYQSMHTPVHPLVIFRDPSWYHYLMVRAAPGKERQAVAALQRIWKKTLPNDPLDYHFLDDGFANLYKSDIRTSSLTLIFALIAVSLSCLGLFGLATYAAEQRSREIGIRKVLGATIPSIATLLSKDFIKLVGIAILIATPIALLAMRKWIENFAYRIHLSWWIFATAGSTALIIAIIIVSLQAIKAAMANPVANLRSE